MLLDASRNVLSRVDHELSRTRQAAGLGRQRLDAMILGEFEPDVWIPSGHRRRSAAPSAWRNWPA